MTYTFEPKKHRYAKAKGTNLRISPKSSTILCRVIRKKPLKRARRLLANLVEKNQSLEGKYYTKASRRMLELLNSCEKNAEFKGLDLDRLFVYASASKGTHFRRRRRKAAFGSTMKTANVEIILVERGKESKTKVSKKKLQEAKHAHKDQKVEKDDALLKEALDDIKEKQEHTMKDAENLEKKVESQ